jgi:iodotyrosine deiodinase
MSEQKKEFTPLHYDRPSPEEMVVRARDFYEKMRTRRSVRMFSDEDIPDEVIDYIIRAAGTSPSGANKQPWHFCVVRDPAVKKNIREGAEAEEKQNYSERFSDEMLGDIEHLGTNPVKEFLVTAPVLIVVFKESYRVADGYKRKNYYVNESVGLASGLLLAAIHYAGLVTVTHTPSPMKFLNQILDRPQNEVPILLLPVGYPAENAVVPDIGRKPLNEIMTRY